MTPAEHLAVAEGLLAYGPLSDGMASGSINQIAAIKAVAHAMIAAAAELGVPHSAAGGGGDSGQAHPAAG